MNLSYLTDIEHHLEAQRQIRKKNKTHLNEK